IIYYHSAINNTEDKHVSLLPLINSSSPPVVTNVIVATLDLNITGLFLNSDSIDSPAFDRLWSDTSQLRKHNIKISAMLLGNFHTLSGNQSFFERNYAFLHDGLKTHNFDGIDIDVEDPTAISLPDVIRLIDRLRRDFGSGFLITMSPVAEALNGGRNLSGFNYTILEAKRGNEIAWYHAQFYNTFGWVGDTRDYDRIVEFGFKPEKVVVGMTTNKANAGGFVGLEMVGKMLGELTKKYEDFKGVAGWEYFDSSPGGQTRPWEWSERMAEFLEVRS
ncbi:glycoside hydrolase, partial [Lindgomyces ingoldianus]